MPGTLHIVATPIGNLEDITLRALRVLKDVALVAAEDTRHTGRLLQHFGIATPMVSMHEHNERGRVARIVERLRAGQDVALVSDAGTPGISDPGALLVREVRAQGLPVTVVPGPSAVTFMAAAAGLDERGFVFAGFPPAKGAARDRWFAEIRDARQPVIFFEAPHRLIKTLSHALNVWGDRELLIGRELTKRFEELVKRPISQALGTTFSPRGEYAMVVWPAEPLPASAASDEEVADVFGQITEELSLARRDAISYTAERLAMAPRQVYEAVERAKRGREGR